MEEALKEYVEHINELLEYRLQEANSSKPDPYWINHYESKVEGMLKANGFLRYFGYQIVYVQDETKYKLFTEV